MKLEPKIINVETMVLNQNNKQQSHYSDFMSHKRITLDLSCSLFLIFNNLNHCEHKKYVVKRHQN